MMPCNVIALVFAGGVGSRMSGADKPKQFLKLGGEAIICHVIDKFEKANVVDGIIVVCLSGWIDCLNCLIQQQGYEKIIAVVPGGRSGQESIYNGLAYAKEHGHTDDNTVVLVHDGVRPLIDEATIEACVNSVKNNGPTATVAPVTETVVEVDGNNVIGVNDRSKCRLARAPQGFIFNDLYAAHRKAKSEGREDFIDSISMMSEYGYPIFIVDGPEENIKITTPRDFLTFKGFVDLEEYEQIWK